MRIGHGYDVHRLVTGRKLILGGVDIPHHLGLLGHSDADVVTHALMDALLGAAALGDIGQHFPDTDPAYRDISSLDLLGRVMALLAAQGWRVENLSLIHIWLPHGRLLAALAGYGAGHRPSAEDFQCQLVPHR